MDQRAIFGGAGGFRTTRWSMVLNAADLKSPENGQALEKLCCAYWFPLYAFVRRKGYGEEEAKDLTQSFFAHLLQRQSLIQADPERGKFRTFLLCSLNNFLANEWDRARAQKRGGQFQIFSLDAADPEDRYRLEPAADDSPERLYDRKWAGEIMGVVLARLRTESNAGGREQWFDVLKGFLFGDGSLDSYKEAARALRTTEQAVKGAALRFRRRLGELLREEIAETVAGENEAEEELRHLLSIVGGQ